MEALRGRLGGLQGSGSRLRKVSVLAGLPLVQEPSRVLGRGLPFCFCSVLTGLRAPVRGARGGHVFLGVGGGVLSPEGGYGEDAVSPSLEDGGAGGGGDCRQPGGSWGEQAGVSTPTSK